MTPAQTKLLHIAARQVGLNDLQRRTIMRNVAGATTSTELSNRDFEAVMAVLESMGFRQTGEAADYWQRKAQRQADGEVSDRMLRWLEAMAAETQYHLGGLVRRHTHGRTEDPAQMTSREAWEVGEMLKRVADDGRAQPENRYPHGGRHATDGATSRQPALPF